MNHRRWVGLLLSLNLLLVGAPTALAHELPSPTPTPGVAPLSEQEQYILSYEHYLRDDIKFEKISDKFTTAVNRANSIYDTAILTAKSDKVKIILKARRESSIVNAIKLRDAAIEEMGGPPVEPTKPVKPVVTAIAKKTKASKPSPTPSP